MRAARSRSVQQAQCHDDCLVAHIFLDSSMALLHMSAVDLPEAAPAAAPRLRQQLPSTSKRAAVEMFAAAAASFTVCVSMCVSKCVWSSSRRTITRVYAGASPVR